MEKKLGVASKSRPLNLLAMMVHDVRCVTSLWCHQHLMKCYRTFMMSITSLLLYWWVNWMLSIMNMMFIRKMPQGFNGIWLLWYQGIQKHTLKTEHCHDANFVITSGTGGCLYDNLQCHQWWQSWHHDNSVSLEIFKKGMTQVKFVRFTFSLLMLWCYQMSEYLQSQQRK